MHDQHREAGSSGRGSKAVGRLPSQRWNEPSLQGLLGGCVAPGPAPSMFSLVIYSRCKQLQMLDIGFLKSCLRKEKTKREKRRGRKMAKRMQTRVSHLSGLCIAAALLGARGGRHPADGRVVAESCLAWALPCGAVRGLLFLWPLSTLPIFRQRLWVVMAPPSTLILTSGGGSKQKYG